MAEQHAATADALTMEREWKLPDRGAVGISFLIITESSLFAIFVAAYLVYIGKSLTGPYPKDVLELPILSTICLLSSSFTIVLAEHALKHDKLGRFKLWWLLTVALGLEFLTATGSPDHTDEPIWNYLLFARRAARQPRHCRALFSASGTDSDPARVPHPNSASARQVPFLVLAFCRRGLGDRLHGCLHHRQVRAQS